MAHPHNELRDHKVSERRLSMFGHMPHRASGGSVNDERQDKALVKSMVKGTSLKADGGKVKARADRPCRARGGKVKKGKGHTSVNVIVAPQGGMGGMPPGPPPGLAPRPPGPPMGAAPPPPGGPPPMMPHKDGGRAYAKGGAVKSGNTWAEGLRDGTQVQHNDSGKTANQKDGQPSRKGMRVVTFWAGGAVKRKTGGPVFSNGKAGAQMAPKLPAGSGGGEGRLAKRKLAYGKPAKEVNGAR